MTDYIVQGESLAAIADKIREKTGDTADLEFPDEFITAIDSLGGQIVTPDDSVLFYSLDEFTLNTANLSKNWDGTVYYSYDHITWNEWNGSPLRAANGKLFLRGINNTRMNGIMAGDYTFRLNGTNIMAYGNIENIFDYVKVANNQPIPFYHNAMTNLFNGQIALVRAPDFGTSPLVRQPDDTSINGMCEGIYYGSGIIDCPKIPTPAVDVKTFRSAFAYCSRLRSLPELLPLAIENSSYEYMFDSCPNIKMSTTRTGIYQNEYRIPAIGTGTAVSGGLSNMFSNTGGSFKSTPTINTTYYTSNEIIPAT